MRWYLAAISALLILPAVTASDITVHYIDVGQGDATLIVYGNWTILIDSGDRYAKQRDKMEAYLADLNITRINLAIATHADPENIGQFTNLMQTISVDEFWVNGLPHASQLWKNMNRTIHELGIPLHVARRHDTYAMGDVTMIVLSPMEPLSGEQNSDSVVVKMTYRDVSFMFMGGAGEDMEYRLLSLSSIWPHADVLKLGGQGSKHSSTGEWLDAVHPSLVIITAGYQNRYGHPHNETLERLSARNITWFRTDIHEDFIDDIVTTTDGYSLRVKQPSTGYNWSADEGLAFCLVFAVIFHGLSYFKPRQRIG